MTHLDPRSGAVVLVLYTRRGCHLCDDLEALVRATLPAGRYRLEKVDVDGERALQDRYGMVVPVLAIEGARRVELETRVAPRDLLAAFEAACAAVPGGR